MSLHLHCILSYNSYELSVCTVSKHVLIYYICINYFHYTALIDILNGQIAALYFCL